MAKIESKLIAPPREEEEVYPYRRVWRSLALEIGILFVLVVVVYGLLGILRVSPPTRFYVPLNIALALTPLALWTAFSLWQERSVPQPRRRLIVVVIISALVANAVGIPFITNVLQPDRWLPLSSAVNRIVGYALTVGVVQETLKYLVLRYTVWSNSFRTRLDGVAYGAASALGYATVLNLQFVLGNTPLPQITAARVFETLALQTAASIIVGYALAELRFSVPTPFLMPLAVALAAFITGVATAFRAGLDNARFSLQVTASQPILGLLFSAVLVVSVSTAFAFLFNTAERQAHEAEIIEE